MNAENSLSIPGIRKDLDTLHIPVLLEETIAALQPRENGRYLDGTIGMGGHSLALLQRVSGRAELCGLDRDNQALDIAGRRLAAYGNAVHLFHCRYSNFGEALASLGWTALDGALIDIGVSSLQIDSAERGFSFLADGPLDMRMDRDSGEAPVSRLVNRGSREELKDIIERYGEDPLAGRIARAIEEARTRSPLTTTRELAEVVERAYPAEWRKKARNHPATRTFQALRMAVNDEIGELERFLDAILAYLKPGGRLAVITFHSLEDRVVKQKMKFWAQGCVCPKSLPVCVCHHVPEVTLVTPKPVRPSDRELLLNPRSSSSKLRVVEKLPAAGASPSGTGTAAEETEEARAEAARLRYQQRREARMARRNGEAGGRNGR